MATHAMGGDEATRPLLGGGARPGNAKSSNDSDRDRAFAIAATCFYAVWTLILCAHHKAWRDEADAWLAVRDMNPAQLYHWLAAGGTPGLWYLLLMPLVKLGLPYVSMRLLHGLLATASAGLIAFRAPFNRPIKLLLIFSYALGYEYAVISRSYVLTVLLLLCIAAVLSNPSPKYWLAGIFLFLLCNANVHGLLFAGIISGVVAIQCIFRRQFSRSMWLGAAITATGAIVAVLQLTSSKGGHAPNSEPNWKALQYSLADAFFPHIKDVLRNHHLGRFLRPLAAIAFLLAVPPLLFMRRAPAALLIVLLSWIGLEYIAVFKWYKGPRHAGLFFVILVFGLWLARPRRAGIPLSMVHRVLRRAGVAAMAGGLAVSCAIGLIWSVRDLIWDYSGASEAAYFLQERSLLAIPLAAGRGQQTESLLPYLPGKKIWYASLQDFGTYTHWDRDWLAEERIPNDEVVRRVKQHFGPEQYLLLLPEPLNDSERDEYKLIFQSNHHIWGPMDERYYLYVHPKED